MAEITVQLKNKFNGYDKAQVAEYIRIYESKLQETSRALAESQHQVETLEARIASMTAGDTTVEEKVALYDKLMKKMDGDYTNLLTPAIAKAKAIEEQAEKEYAIRMDQARFAAEGIYAETAERITGVVDTAVNNNMDRIYNLLDEFIYSKTLPGRMNAFVANCKAVAEKIKQAPANAAAKVKAAIAKKNQKAAVAE